MTEKMSLKESVDLIKIKTGRLIEGNEKNLLLKDDIWEKGALIIKSGAYLTEEIINKLLKFGIRKVCVSINNIESKQIVFEKQNHLMNQFINTQGVLIVEKNLINAGTLIKQLVDNGFKEGNIFLTKEPSFINSYFRAKQINFLFIDEDLYESCKKCVEKYSLLRNVHAFVLSNAKNKFEKTKIGISKIKFLSKHINEQELSSLIYNALERNYIDFWHYEEEALIS